MDPAAQPAVRASDHVLPAHRLGEPGDPVGDEFRVLDHVGGVADHARDDDLARRELDVLPHLPLVLVPRVARLEHVGAGVDGQHHVHDVPHRQVGRVRPVPASPAEVEPDAVPGQTGDRVVERLDPGHREPLVLLDAGGGIDLVPVLRDARVVKLEYQPGVHDRPVLLAHRVRARVQELLVAGIELVADPGAASRRDRRHEALLDPGRGQRGLEVGDVGGHRLLAGVGQRSAADREQAGRRADRGARRRVAVGLGEAHPVPPVAERRQRDLPRLGRAAAAVGQRGLHQFEAAQPMEGVRPPGAVVHLLAHGLAVFAVVRHVDAGVPLPPHQAGHCRPQPARERRLVHRSAGQPGPVELDQVVGPRQAPRVRGQDPVIASSHRRSPIVTRG